MLAEGVTGSDRALVLGTLGRLLSFRLGHVLILSEFISFWYISTRVLTPCT